MKFGIRLAIDRFALRKLNDNPLLEDPRFPTPSNFLRVGTAIIWRENNIPTSCVPLDREFIFWTRTLVWIHWVPINWISTNKKVTRCGSFLWSWSLVNSSLGQGSCSQFVSRESDVSQFIQHNSDHKCHRTATTIILSIILLLLLLTLPCLVVLLYCPLTILHNFPERYPRISDTTYRDAIRAHWWDVGAATVIVIIITISHAIRIIILATCVSITLLVFST